MTPATLPLPFDRPDAEQIRERLRRLANDGRHPPEFWQLANELAARQAPKDKPKARAKS